MQESNNFCGRTGLRVINVKTHCFTFKTSSVGQTHCACRLASYRIVIRAVDIFIGVNVCLLHVFPSINDSTVSKDCVNMSI